MKKLFSFYFIFHFYLSSFCQLYGNNFYFLKDYQLNGNIQNIEEVCYSKLYLTKEEESNPNKKFKKDHQIILKFNKDGIILESNYQDFNHKYKTWGYSFKKDKPMKPPKYLGGKKILKQVFQKIEDTIFIQIYESKFIGLNKNYFQKFVLSNGKSIFFETHDRENNLLIQTEYTYNNEGLLSQTDEFIYQENKKTIYEYDNQNNLISEIEINESQNDTTKYNYFYNENNLLIQSIIYYSNNQTYYLYKYFYDKNNLLIKLNLLVDGEYDIDYFYSYNEKKDMIEEKTIFSLPQIEGYSKTYEYQYDQFDNITEYKVYHDGVLYQYYKRKYTYY